LSFSICHFPFVIFHLSFSIIFHLSFVICHYLSVVIFGLAPLIAVKEMKNDK